LEDAVTARLKRLFPLTADYLACSGRTSSVIHAATFTLKAKTVEPVCGATRPRMVYYGARCVTPDGPAVLALVWPPPAKHGEHTRCRECWEATGKKRPDPTWKDVSKS
jgi:hypothetical protein